MINDDLRSKIEKLLSDIDVKLYDIEMLKENNTLVLRFYIYKDGGGVDLDLCAKVHEMISYLLDVELESLNNYTLEISSPGIERVLKNKNHFILSKGSLIEIKLKDKSIVEGILGDFLDSSFEIIIDDEVKTIDLANCKKVRTIFKW